VRGHRPVAGVQHRQHTREVLLADLEEVVHQADDPRPREPVHAARAAVLGGLPPHELPQHPRIALVEDEPHLTGVPPQPPLLLQGRLGQPRIRAPQPFRVAAVARLQVDDRGGEQARHIPAERLLLLHQVVELEADQPARPQQLVGVPGDARPVHQGLTVRQAEADGPADAEQAPLVRQEADGLPVLVQDRHVRPAAMGTHPGGELRRQEGVGVLGRLVHRPVPGPAQLLAELVGSVDRDVHSDQPPFRRLRVGRTGRGTGR
jgi:hypothetical protein